MKLDSTGLNEFLRNKNMQEAFSSMSRELGDLQVRYSKFLSPQLTLSLMSVQLSLRAIEHASLMFTIQTEASEMGKIFDKTYPQWRRDIEKVNNAMISAALKRLIDEIYNIYQNKEIKFGYP